MNDQTRTVQMHIITPGKTAPDGEFNFEMQPRSNGARIVGFSLHARDAELLRNALDAYLKDQK